MTTCYINGTYQDILKSKVSITDRGFQFSDGVYEVIAIYENKFVDMELHLKRLMTSLNKLKIKINLNLNQIENISKKINNSRFFYFYSNKNKSDLLQYNLIKKKSNIIFFKFDSNIHGPAVPFLVLKKIINMKI